MRNDSLDELDDLPSLTSVDRLPPSSPRQAFAGAVPRTVAPAPARRAALPWLLVGLLLAALGGLGWWSQQQLERLEMQLVATQESFARISEDAAGRLKDISGKVVATESSVTSENEALKLRIKQLEGRLAEFGKRQQAVADSQEDQGRRLERLHGELQGQQAGAAQLSAALKEQQAGVAGLKGRIEGLADEQAALKTAQGELKKAQGELGKLDGRLQTLAGEVETLKKRGNPAPAIKRLEDDLLVLRSELDSRPAASGTAELDAFRAQVTRNVTTLQAQVRNLQRQLDAR